MKPLHPIEAKQTYIQGRSYWLSDRSEKNHAHHFAWLNTAWRNLPRDLSDRFPTSEHLRKFALIKAGYYDERIIDVGTRAGALRVASYIRGADDFAWCATRGGLVVVRTAKSQAVIKMDAGEFKKSKEAIREIVANMIGISPEDLDANAHSER